MVFAQEAKIKLRQTGFGKIPKEVHFTVHNIGETLITNVTIFVDGNVSKMIKGITSPGKGFAFFLYLDPGEHLIEVKTPEGAYDSVRVTVSSIQEKPPYIPPEEPKSFLEEYLMLIGLAALIVIIVIIAWLLTRKPRLKV